MPRFRTWLNVHGVPGGWIALQWNGTSGVGNRAAWPRVRDAAIADGTITPGIWLTRDFNHDDCVQALTYSQAPLIVLEGEVPAYANGQPNPQAPSWDLIAQQLLPFDKVDKAVATNWSPFQNADGTPSRELAGPLMRHGWYCLPYVYPAEHPGITVDKQLSYAQHYAPQWAKAEPVLGVYGGFTVASPAFNRWRDCNGASLWDAGEVL